MTTPTPDNPAQGVPAAEEEVILPLGPMRRAYPIETRIAAERVHLLMSLCESSRWSVFGGTAVVALALSLPHI